MIPIEDRLKTYKDIPSADTAFADKLSGQWQASQMERYASFYARKKLAKLGFTGIALSTNSYKYLDFSGVKKVTSFDRTGEFSAQLARETTLRDGASEIQQWLEAAVSGEVQLRSPATPLRNLGFAAEEALLGGMFAFGLRQDPVEAAQWFSQAERLSNAFLKLSTSGLPGTPWTAFHLLHCNVLAGDFELASQLSEHLVERFANPIAPEDVVSLLLALSILDRSADFESGYKASIERRKKKPLPFHQWLFSYLELHSAIARRDQADFEKQLQDREVAFVASGKDHRLTGTRIEFGGGLQNELVFDFMRVVAARLALRSGMSVHQGSRSFPIAMVTHGQRGHGARSSLD